MRKLILIVSVVSAMLSALTSCGSGRERGASAAPASGDGGIRISGESDISETSEASVSVLPAGPAETEEANEKMLRMTIGDTDVAVDWENNESAEALKALCENGPLVIRMSMYGGFEQVGPIGTSLPSNDVQTATSAGDIVLYSSDRIVVFYGSNSWSYTRLGHITDRDASGMAALLGNGDVTVTISLDDAG